MANMRAIESTTECVELAGDRAQRDKQRRIVHLQLDKKFSVMEFSKALKKLILN